MKKTLLILGLMLMCGCATTQSVARKFEMITYDDGITKKEAVVIAQNKLLAEDFKRQYFVSAPDVKRIDDFWSVAFLFKATTAPSSEYFQTFYRVDVDAKTGEIREARIHKASKFGWGFKLHDRDM